MWIIAGLWKSFVYWFAGILAGPPMKGLEPDDCMCGHMRCSHTKGIGRCHGYFTPDEETKEWTRCACQIFITDGGRGDDDEDDPEPDIPTAEDLHKLYNR